MNPSQLKNIKISNHSYERYYQRVARTVEGSMDNEMKRWFATAISKGVRLPETGENGALMYLYRGHRVAYDPKKNTVVTVLPYKPHIDKESGYHLIKDEIGSLVEKKLSKNMRTLRHQHRQLMIALHTEEIKRLSVYNPNTQDTIAKRVLEIQKKVIGIEGQIKGIEDIAEQYGVIL